MLLLPLVALVIIGVLAAWRVLGRDDTGERRPAHGGLVMAGGAVGLVLVVVLAAAAVGLVGGRSGDSDDDARRDERVEAPGVPAAGPPRLGEPPALARLTVDAQDPHALAGDPVIDRLRPGGVVRIEARGFDSFERGTIEQCVTERGRRPRCANRFPVQFDSDGAAVLQYRLVDVFAAGRCRSDEATCSLGVQGAQSARRGSVQTVFVDAYRAGRVRVRPDRDLEAGQTIDVAVAGLSPGAVAEVVFCAPPGRYDPNRCQVDGTRVTIGADGTGTGRLAVAGGRIGSQRASCGPRRGCSVIVLSGKGFLAGPAVPVRYSLGPGHDYTAARVAGGLVVALVLISVAVVLARSTDWATPTEAATPEMDAADLETTASLDDLFGTDAQLDALAPLGPT